MAGAAGAPADSIAPAFATIQTRPLHQTRPLFATCRPRHTPSFPAVVAAICRREGGPGVVPPSPHWHAPPGTSHHCRGPLPGEKKTRPSMLLRPLHQMSTREEMRERGAARAVVTTPVAITGGDDGHGASGSRGGAVHSPEPRCTHGGDCSVGGLPRRVPNSPRMRTLPRGGLGGGQAAEEVALWYAPGRKIVRRGRLCGERSREKAGAR